MGRRRVLIVLIAGEGAGRAQRITSRSHVPTRSLRPCHIEQVPRHAIHRVCVAQRQLTEVPASGSRRPFRSLQGRSRHASRRTSLNSDGRAELCVRWFASCSRSRSRSTQLEPEFDFPVPENKDEAEDARGGDADLGPHAALGEGLDKQEKTGRGRRLHTSCGAPESRPEFIRPMRQSPPSAEPPRSRPRPRKSRRGPARLDGRRAPWTTSTKRE